VILTVLPQYFGLFASPAYLESRGEPQTLEALSAHDCLTASSRAGSAVWSLVGPEGPVEWRVVGRFSANQTRDLSRAAVAGLGIALLPALQAMSDLAAGRLRRVLPEYRRDGADLNVVLPSRRQIPAAVAAFIDFVQAKMGLHDFRSAG